MKRVQFFLIVLILFYSTGCASVQKKFTRKKPEKRAIPVVYLQEGPYQKQYTHDYYYKIHFTQWSTWQGELLTQWGGNRKKIRRCAQEALGHLTEMNRCLKEDKQIDLKPWLEKLKTIVQKIEGGAYSDSDESLMKSELEKIQRIISSHFYYDKVKESVLPDPINLGQ